MINSFYARLSSATVQLRVCCMVHTEDINIQGRKCSVCPKLSSIMVATTWIYRNLDTYKQTCSAISELGHKAMNKSNPTFSTRLDHLSLPPFSEFEIPEIACLRNCVKHTVSAIPHKQIFCMHTRQRQWKVKYIDQFNCTRTMSSQHTFEHKIWYNQRWYFISAFPYNILAAWLVYSINRHAMPNTQPCGCAQHAVNVTVNAINKTCGAVQNCSTELPANLHTINGYTHKVTVKDSAEPKPQSVNHRLPTVNTPDLVYPSAYHTPSNLVSVHPLTHSFRYPHISPSLPLTHPSTRKSLMHGSVEWHHAFISLTVPTIERCVWCMQGKTDLLAFVHFVRSRTIPVMND